MAEKKYKIDSFIKRHELIKLDEEPHVLNYSPEIQMRERLKRLILENNSLPIEARRSKLTLLIEAGYPEEKARMLADILVEGGKETILPKRGFDENSAKKVISDIAHDENNKPDVRLKAAEDMLKILGVFKEPDKDGGAATIMAQLLKDIFDRSENSPKIIEGTVLERETVEQEENDE